MALVIWEYLCFARLELTEDCSARATLVFEIDCLEMSKLSRSDTEVTSKPLLSLSLLKV